PIPQRIVAHPSTPSTPCAGRSSSPSSSNAPAAKRMMMSRTGVMDLDLRRSHDDAVAGNFADDDLRVRRDISGVTDYVGDARFSGCRIGERRVSAGFELAGRAADGADGGPGFRAVVDRGLEGG